jgi:hypothetical protein
MCPTGYKLFNLKDYFMCSEGYTTNQSHGARKWRTAQTQSKLPKSLTPS